MYDYYTPPGYGDTFFQYVFDAQTTRPALVNGTTVIGQLGIPVLDGSFVARQWSGLNTIASSLQIYDWLRRKFFSDMVNFGVGATGGITGFYGCKPILPEVEWPDSGKILFDLGNVQLTSNGVDHGVQIYGSQLVFTGVRRRPNVVSDPAPSDYKYYEKDYSIPFTLDINNLATTNGVFNPPIQYIIPVQDFDFELRRVEMDVPRVSEPSQFKILMYNSDWRQLANSAVLANLFCHRDTSLSAGELCFWPSPPVLYRVNSVIRFDIFSLVTDPDDLPAEFQLTFKGVRRIPC